MKKFMKENYLNSNIKLNRFNGFLSVFQIEINPKVTKKFNIMHAPAVIFIKNYDKTIQESQELQETSSIEQAFIAYGAVNINYALREINKKAKSKGLEKLLGKLDESFFNKQSSK